ncbi:hypothetical protein PoB_003811200 [Plakobranchus ocellatus]|uniref:Uncharacterized protein n=1 Tax=Plakobranchus ocellatus TaxID=259542 RepID=A0AAV4AX19_9GAST|nr:hypothetical protein PoB_003811200 [Plakobranchus ocellatus]
MVAAYGGGWVDGGSDSGHVNGSGNGEGWVVTVVVVIPGGGSGRHDILTNWSGYIEDIFYDNQLLITYNKKRHGRTSKPQRRSGTCS